MFLKCHLCIVLKTNWDCSHLWQPLHCSIFPYGSLASSRARAARPPGNWPLGGRGERSFLWRSTGLPLKTCHFLYFAPCHQIRMRCSDRRVLCKRKPAWVSIPTKSQLYKCIDDDDGTSKSNSKVCGDTASYVGNIWVWFFSTYAVSVEPFQCNVLFLCVFVVSFFPLFPSLPPPLPRSSILSRTGRKESQEASNLAVPMTMCLFPVPFPLTPSLRPQVSSINPTVTRSLLYSVLRDAPADRGGATQQSREVQISDYPSLDYQGLYATRHLAWPGAPAAARSARWVQTAASLQKTRLSISEKREITLIVKRHSKLNLF